MKFRIKETGEVKELKAIDNNGIEWTNDLLGNNDALHYNRETEEYEMDKDDFDWWEEYISNLDADEREAEALADELEIDLDLIKIRIIEAMQHENDLGDEHNIKQSLFEEIKDEYRD